MFVRPMRTRYQKEWIRGIETSTSSRREKRENQTITGSKRGNLPERDQPFAPLRSYYGT